MLCSRDQGGSAGRNGGGGFFGKVQGMFGGSNSKSSSNQTGYGALSDSPTHANALAVDERGGLLQEDDEL